MPRKSVSHKESCGCEHYDEYWTRVCEKHEEEWRELHTRVSDEYRDHWTNKEIEDDNPI